MTDVYDRYKSMGTWRAKHITRTPSRETGLKREGKRNRCLGNAINRSIYTNARGHMHRNYGSLCKRVDSFNNIKRTEIED